MDLDARPVARRRGDEHPAAGRLDPDALRREADVAVREPLAEPLGREAEAVVLDDELDLVPRLCEADRDQAVASA